MRKRNKTKIKTKNQKEKIRTAHTTRYWWSARFHIYHSTESRMLPIELFKIKIKTQRTAKFIQTLSMYIFVVIHTSTCSRTHAERALSVAKTERDWWSHYIYKRFRFCIALHHISARTGYTTIFNLTHVCASECTVWLYYCKEKRENNNNKMNGSVVVCHIDRPMSDDEREKKRASECRKKKDWPIIDSD